MRRLITTNVRLLNAALCTFAFAVPAIAAPPVAAVTPSTANDDMRVGAPPVIVTRPAVTTNPPPAAPALKPTPAKISRPVQPPPASPVAQIGTANRTPPAVVVVPPRVLPPVPANVAPPVRRQAAVPPAPRVAPPLLPQAASLAPEQSDRRGAGPVGAGYHRPEYGYQLPAEWAAPDYYISDIESYDLPRPAAGFGWSRYYDDAVLTDQWGRVYDWRDDVNWADHDERHSRDWGREHGSQELRDYGKSRGKKYDYKGHWTGSWDGGPVRTYQGEWRGNVRPHWRGDYNGGNGGGGSSYGGGGYAASYGYDGGGTTVTTVVIQAAAPVMMTETISYDVVSYVPVRAKAVRRYKPRPKPVCVCGS